MSIRWKVVTKERKSWSCHLMDKWLPPSLYRTYREGTVVTAHPKSLGLMAFETEEQAKSFKRQERLPGTGALPSRLMVIKVKGIGRGRKINEVPAVNGLTLKQVLEPTKDILAHKFLSVCTWLVPEGTICYQKVLVLT